MTVYVDPIQRSMPTPYRGGERETPVREDVGEGYWTETIARVTLEEAADRRVARDMNEGLPRDPFA